MAPGPSRDMVLCRHVLCSNGRGNAALDRGWEHFQTQILALLLWHFLSWLKSNFFFFSSTCTQSKKIILLGQRMKLNMKSLGI